MPSVRRPIELIVNADDFNLTEGVSDGILEAHDEGIVTSTSLLINLPFSRASFRQLRRRKALSVGLHLNLTLGHPVSRADRVPSLVRQGGEFIKRKGLDLGNLSSAEIGREYEAQIERFRRIFGRLPSHLDTHHHLHEKKKVFDVLMPLAVRYHLPLRRSRLCRAGIMKRLAFSQTCFTDYLWEDLEPARAWDEERLIRTIRSLRPGRHELMCHPARCDARLMKISSFHQPREQELVALCAAGVRQWVRKRGIRLISFHAFWSRDGSTAFRRHSPATD